jgi:hypothetical protein
MMTDALLLLHLLLCHLPAAATFILINVRSNAVAYLEEQ